MLRKALFFRILGIFILAGIAVNVLVVASFRGVFFNDPARKLGQRHIGNYLNYVIEDFDNPPSAEKIERFKRGFQIDVRVEDRGGSALHGADLPSIAELQPHVMRDGPWMRPVGNFHGRFFLIYETPALNYVFLMPKHLGHDVSETTFVVLILGLTVILGLAYYLIRRILNKELNARVAESVQAKEQLLRDVSHELRSPQTRMRVALELMPDSHAKQAIFDDLAEMERMTQLILESARFGGTSEKRPLVEVDLSEMVRELAASFRDTPPGIDLQRLPSHLRTQGDPEWMRIAIRNVLDNALKYSREAKNPVEVRGARKDDGIHLWIEDHGVGIPEAELARIFEPFHRVDRSRAKATGGFGLGLHLTKKALEAQGASIEISSEPGEGTTALLRFR